MRTRRIHLLLPLLLALAVSNTARAIDDIDVYVHDGQNDNDNLGVVPMVMFVLDYRPNMFSTICEDVSTCPTLDYFKRDTDFILSRDPVTNAPLTYDSLIPTSGKLNFFQLLTIALKKVANNLSNVQIGLMISHNHEANCAGPQASKHCSNGAYVLYGFKDFGTGDANTDANKVAFFNKLTAIPSTDATGNGHPYQGKELYFELYRYLTGRQIYNGHNGWTDYGTNNTQNLPGDNALISWDNSATVEDATRPGYYKTPLLDHCSKVYVINLLGGTTNQEDDSDSAISASSADGGMNGLRVKGKLRFEDVLSWMNKTDLATDLNGNQNVNSFFLTRADRSNVDSFAMAGGSGQAILLSTDPATLVSQINSIFIQVKSTSTSFVAASVPVNVFTRGEIMNNVYIALFQAETTPLWNGNLKKLKFNEYRTLLLDAQVPPVNAIDSTDGRILYSALTYWTIANLLPAPRQDTLEQSGKDGRVVDRGGAGQIVPGFLSGSVGEINGTGTRQLFTEPNTFTNGTATDLLALNADDATAAALQTDLGAAAATTTNAKCLLRYIRGFNVSSLDTCTDTTHRDWLLGDVLHGRPLAISYGARTGYTADNPDIRIIMNGNDGFAHMFRDTDGKEVWAFMPRAVMPIINTLRTNVGDHPYGVDGAPVVYIKDVDHDGTVESGDGDKVYLFFGLRRGGKAYYALDITNPDSPQMLWQIDKTTPSFDKLGLTYSAPRIAEIDYDGTGRKPVVVFGGGYDIDKDSWDVGADDDEGNALYIVNAATGALVWKAVKGSGSPTSTVYQHPDLNDSIPSEVTTVDSDGDGLLDRVYVGDTGGVVWRADLAGTDRTHWFLSKILSVGRHAHPPTADYPDNTPFDRRFFHRPDFVMAKDATGAFDAVIIGSGDRVHPTQEGVMDYFYVFKDRNTTSGVLPDNFTTKTDTNLTDVTDFCLNGCSLPDNTTLTNGWRLALEASGEKALATPLTIAGTIYFTTYIPANSDALSTTCSPEEGAGRLYKVSLQTGFAVPNPDIENKKNVEDLTKEDRYEDLASGGIPAEVIPVPPDKILAPDLKTHDIKTKSSWRTYWYKVEK